MSDNNTGNQPASWKNAPHIFKDVAGTIATSFETGDATILRCIPPGLWIDFIAWAKSQ